LGRIISPSAGYRLADFLAGLIVLFQRSHIVQSVRANQWLITGQKLKKKELDQITLDTFRHTAQCLYDLYHYLPYPQQVLQMVTLSEKLKKLVTERSQGRQGTIFIAPHMSNFDMAGRALALHGYRIQVLSYPQPPGGYQWQNKLRQDYGIEITPMSTESLRAAKALLRNGGAILTGMDRPLDNANYSPRFFGYPAKLPVSYVRLGIQTNSPVVVVACTSNGRGKYTVDCSDLISMKPYADVNSEIVKNAEKALVQAEKFIMNAPYQWSMFYPVWPWSLEKMP
jgi:KDO2-lipid IV(A) lauroyltransferase